MRYAKKIIKGLAVSALMLSMTACGHDPGERALSGAGIGAGVGVVGTVLTGGCITCGAVVGGAVGAAAGGLTSDKQINLGR